MTSEHYFQAQKFIGSDFAEEIRLAKTPMEAAKMGRERNKPIRKDWDATCSCNLRNNFEDIPVPRIVTPVD